MWCRWIRTHTLVVTGLYYFQKGTPQWQNNDDDRKEQGPVGQHPQGELGEYRRGG